MTEVLARKERISRFLRKQRGERLRPIRVTKEDVFRYMCESTAKAGLFPVSTSKIASQFGATKYNVRKCIRELASDGLVRRTHASVMDYDGCPHCFHGFALTEKAQKTSVYEEHEEKAMEESAAFIRDIFEDY